MRIVSSSPLSDVDEGESLLWDDLAHLSTLIDTALTSPDRDQRIQEIAELIDAIASVYSSSISHFPD
jgi:hypothetical protein